MDGTLLSLFKYHRPGMRAALKQVYGLDEMPIRPEYPGHTMLNFMRMALRDSGYSADAIETGIEKASQLQVEITLSLFPDDLRSAVLPGVVSLLDALQQDGHALALVTGTQSLTGRAALDRTGLQSYFPVCAFGDEVDVRIDLLHLALRRAAREYNLKPAPAMLVVIGDSPRDISAARAIGARAIAVATGNHSLDALAQHNPDTLLPSFEDWQVALEAIEA